MESARSLELTSSNGSVVSAVSKVVPALGRSKSIDEPPDRGPETIDGSLRRGSHESLELGEGVLDGIEVGTIGRQVEVTDAAAFERVAYRGGFVSREVVENHQVAGPALRREDLLDVGLEGVAVHRSIEHHRSNEAAGGETAEEGGGFPVAIRDEVDESLSLGSVAVESIEGGG